MIEGASVEPTSEILQFSLPSKSKEKGWEGLSSMKLGFGNFESEFWLRSNLSKMSWKTTNPQILCIKHSDEDSVKTRLYTGGRVWDFFSFGCVFWGFVVILLCF